MIIKSTKCRIFLLLDLLHCIFFHVPFKSLFQQSTVNEVVKLAWFTVIKFWSGLGIYPTYNFYCVYVTGLFIFTPKIKGLLIDVLILDSNSCYFTLFYAFLSIIFLQLKSYIAYKLKFIFLLSLLDSDNLFLLMTTFIILVWN